MASLVPTPPPLIRDSYSRAVPFNEFHSPPLIVLLNIELRRRQKKQALAIWVKTEFPRVQELWKALIKETKQSPKTN